MAEQGPAPEFRVAPVAMSLPDIAELIANGYTITIKRDENDRGAVFFTLGRDNLHATFHGAYMRCLTWAYQWANNQ